MGFERFIDLIRDGENVSAGVTNRPTRQLDQNIRYVWDVLQSIGLGSTLYARWQPVDSDLQIGQPVYFDSATKRFRAALAVTETDTVSGYLTIPERAQVWGIVAYKHALDAADILLAGYTQVDIREAVDVAVDTDDFVPAGLWYLSGESIGKLTRQTPPVTLPVLRTDATGGVYVNPSFHDYLENHRHYVFRLTMSPAGDTEPPDPGDPHTITNANDELPGWLPAGHESFDDSAPEGAKFGYNIAADPVLAAVFPPVPLQSVCVTMQRPSVYDSESEHRWYGQELMDDLIVVNRSGIWWMKDCYDEVPWPTDLDTAVSESASADDCDPADRDYVLKLYFTRVGFATGNSVVSSLESLDPRIIVACDNNGSPAMTGELKIDLDLSFLVAEEDDRRAIGIKSFDPDAGTFAEGPLTVGVFSETSNVILSGDDTFTDGDGNTIYHGLVGISVLDQASQEISSQLVRLDGVTEENYPVLYLGMPNDLPTSFVVKFEVPTLVPPDSSFRYRIRILGRTTGTLPQLTAEYYKATRPVAGLTTPVAVSQSYTSMTIVTVASVTANTAVEATSEEIEVDPGDIVYIRVSRDPDDAGDAYSGELGIMQQVGILVPAVEE